MKRRAAVGIAAAALAVVCLSYAALAFTGMSRAVTLALPQSARSILPEPVANDAPNAEQIRQGHYLVRVGDCAACHTAEGRPPLAGGLALNTPFGVIYSTNLTSDVETGVGGMSSDKFYAVLHKGVGPRGGRVYPAMPYNYFTRVTRADSDAILAYLQTTPAVHAKRPSNKLVFPLNFRFLVRGWNLLSFSPGEFKPDPEQSAEWNRGAYLVTGLGHCGSCHTPKNAIAADKSGQSLRGGELDTWFAPDLTSNTRTGLGQWSVEDIVEYLKTGRNKFSNAGGPMAEVVSYSTSLMTDEDLRAIATYLKGQPASPSPHISNADPAAMRRGEAIYSDACASCHMLDGMGQPRFFPPLAGNAALQQSDPSGPIHLILAGSRTGPTPTRPTPLSMPSFSWKLTDQQIADVSTYVRNSWSNRAPPVTAGNVADMRKALGLTTVRLTDNSGDDPSSSKNAPGAVKSN